MASARGLAPKLSLPWMRTLTVLASISRFYNHKHPVNYHLLGDRI